MDVEQDKGTDGSGSGDQEKAGTSTELSVEEQETSVLFGQVFSIPLVVDKITSNLRLESLKILRESTTFLDDIISRNKDFLGTARLILPCYEKRSVEVDDEEEKKAGLLLLLKPTFSCKNVKLETYKWTPEQWDLIKSLVQKVENLQLDGSILDLVRKAYAEAPVPPPTPMQAPPAPMQAPPAPMQAPPAPMQAPPAPMQAPPAPMHAPPAQEDDENDWEDEEDEDLPALIHITQLSDEYSQEVFGPTLQHLFEVILGCQDLKVLTLNPAFFTLAKLDSYISIIQARLDGLQELILKLCISDETGSMGLPQNRNLKTTCWNLGLLIEALPESKLRALTIDLVDKSVPESQDLQDLILKLVRKETKSLDKLELKMYYSAGMMDKFADIEFPKLKCLSIVCQSFGKFNEFLSKQTELDTLYFKICAVGSIRFFVELHNVFKKLKKLSLVWTFPLNLDEREDEMMIHEDHGFNYWNFLTECNDLEELAVFEPFIGEHEKTYLSLQDVIKYLRPNAFKKIDFQGLNRVFCTDADVVCPDPITTLVQQQQMLKILDFKLCGFELRDEDMQIICRDLTYLEVLGIPSGTELTDFGVTGTLPDGNNTGYGLASLKRMKELTILECSEITQDGYLSSIQFSDLIKLTLGCAEIDMYPVSFFQQLVKQNKCLETLKVREFIVSNISLSELKLIAPGLRELGALDENESLDQARDEDFEQIDEGWADDDSSISGHGFQWGWGQWGEHSDDSILDFLGYWHGEDSDDFDVDDDDDDGEEAEDINEGAVIEAVNAFMNALGVEVNEGMGGFGGPGDEVVGGFDPEDEEEDDDAGDEFEEEEDIEAAEADFGLEEEELYDQEEEEDYDDDGDEFGPAY